MITVVIKHNGNAVINFPCRESELSNKLNSIGAYGEQNAPHFYIEEVKEPEILAKLKGQYVNLDELNYFAKIIAGFCKRELCQLYAAIEIKDSWDVKDLINLTFNLPHYTLIQDVSNMEAVGKAYILAVTGYLPLPTTENEKQMAEKGKAILSSHKYIATNYGLVYEDEGIALQDVYDGEVFPDFRNYRGKALLSAKIEYNGRTEILYLPEEEQAMKKLLARLGAETFSECAIGLVDVALKSGDWMQRVQNVMNCKEIFEANRLLEALQKVKNELDKLSAVANYTNADSADKIITLADKLNWFVYIENIKGNFALGKYYTENFIEFDLNRYLEDYFDYDKFGEYLKNAMYGVFVEGCFIGLKSGHTLADVFSEVESDNMTMGGI